MSLHRVADAVARALSARIGMPVAPVPLARTEAVPWEWATPAARVVGADPAELAAALADEPLLRWTRARSDGWVVLRLDPGPFAAHLVHLAAGLDLPRPAASPVGSCAEPRAEPVPGGDVERFEAARRAGGARALDPGIAARRVLDNPVVAVQLAHARAAGLRLSWAEASDLPMDPGPTAAADLGRLADPLDAVLLTEVLEAPRALATQATHPDRLAAALMAVATAYLPWWERRAPRPGEPDAAARLLVSEAGRGVLHAGMARLGVHAPARM